MRERLRLSFFSLAQAGWVALKSGGKALLGEERFDRLVGASGLRELKARTWLTERQLPDGSVILLRPSDQTIVDEVYGGGVYGGERILPGQTVVDAGGHIGTFALMAGRRVGPEGRVIVFEPSPATLALLKRNLELNPMPWVKLHACALGAKDGLATLYVSTPGDGNPAADSLHPSKDRERVEVPLRPLDEVLAEDGVGRVDHLKIDVEGAELMVLDGAPKALASAGRVLMEVHTLHVSRQEALSRLKAAGLTVRVVSEAEHGLIVEATRA